VVVGGGGGGGGSLSFFLPSSFFFFVSVDGEVDVVDDVSVIIVSVGGGGAVVSVAAVAVCGGWSRGGGCVVRSRGIAGVVLPIVSVTTGAFVVRVDGRGRAAGIPGVPAGYDGTTGIPDAIEPPAVSLPSGFGLVGSVKFVVVSTFVFVIGGVVSPGPLIVDVTPLAEPSWTV
jgi:hypothetical protein